MDSWNRVSKISFYTKKLWMETCMVRIFKKHAKIYDFLSDQYTNQARIDEQEHIINIQRWHPPTLIQIHFIQTYSRLLTCVLVRESKRIKPRERESQLVVHQKLCVCERDNSPSRPCHVLLDYDKTLGCMIWKENWVVTIEWGYFQRYWGGEGDDKLWEEILPILQFKLKWNLIDLELNT